MGRAVTAFPGGEKASKSLHVGLCFLSFSRDYSSRSRGEDGRRGHGWGAVSRLGGGMAAGVPWQGAVAPAACGRGAGEEPSGAGADARLRTVRCGELPRFALGRCLRA